MAVNPSARVWAAASCADAAAAKNAAFMTRFFIIEKQRFVRSGPGNRLWARNPVIRARLFRTGRGRSRNAARLNPGAAPFAFFNKIGVENGFSKRQ